MKNEQLHLLPKHVAIKDRGKKLQPAPVDEKYGTQGYSYVLGQDAARHSICTAVIASLTRPGVYYAAGYFYRTPDDKDYSFIQRLDADGKIEPGFIKFDAHLTQQLSFVPMEVVEDAAGKVLCLGRLYDADTDFSRLWRFNADGTLDNSFADKGYVDGTELTLDADFAPQFISYTDGYLLIGSRDRTQILAALDQNGNLKKDFGDGGVVDLEAIFKYRGSASAMATSGQKILVSFLATDAEQYFSVLASFNSNGTLDTAFADQGMYRSENGIRHRGLSVHDASAVITLFGHHLDDPALLYPQVQRLDASGQPLLQFNDGKPVRFYAAGGWHHMYEFDGRLMGYGSFYTYHLAVCYTLEGTLDSSFVPPDGYGELGVDANSDGFFANSDASIAFVPESQRMLVAGQGVYNNGFSADAAVAAISYKMKS
ncbi:hypothetical protein ACIPZ5_19975 [Pseudomonas sp. NPDC089428]|uniref:hypothetical protein n=1 Tax=Pseudomonas sp. NPDC089428 TaxID=3364467 RepID=UPI00381BF086